MFHPARFFVCLVAQVLAPLCLSGCADLNWERALYEGQRSAAEQCRRARRAADAPCPVLPPYEHYEKDRAAARNATPPAEAVPR